MPRVKGGPRGHRKHVKILKLAKGYRGTRSKLFKRANEAVVRAGEHAFAGRRQRRRDLRRLWIMRINGALTSHEIKYSKFMDGLKKVKIELDRKNLSEMAINDEHAFKKVVERVKEVSG
ncbi:MAG TPA: 50S ribosomal protein L20 [Patescibacteria group bacterium]|nr:50S ribosomal protein L20 [Patescibacteria group bacterium]